MQPEATNGRSSDCIVSSQPRCSRAPSQGSHLCTFWQSLFKASALSRYEIHLKSMTTQGMHQLPRAGFEFVPVFPAHVNQGPVHLWALPQRQKYAKTSPSTSIPVSQDKRFVLGNAADQTPWLSKWFSSKLSPLRYLSRYPVETLIATLMRVQYPHRIHVCFTSDLLQI